MTASVGPGFLNLSLDALVNRELDKGGRDILETLQKASAATSMTASAEMLLEPASKKAKLHSEPPVDSAEAALMRAGRKKPPWTTTEQAIVAIKHCELGNRWTQIAAYLPMRSENDVKNIWHSTLRCKDTQKRSFLRTYALAVHDHAYDYATRKSMFDMAVRQCGQPPPQAMETIARIQAYLDNPELQAAQQQQQEQQQQQLQHHQQQEQLAKLTHLLHHKHGDIQHHQFAQLLAQQNLLLLQEPSDAVETTDDHPRSLSEGAGTVQAPNRGNALDASKDLDARRPRSARDKYHGKYGADLYGEMQQQRLGAEDSVTTDTMTLLPSGSVQLPSNQVAAALRSQLEHSAANTEHHWGHSDSGMSAMRRFGGSAKPGSGGYPVASADLSASLAQMAAAVAADSMSNAALQAAVAAGGATGDLPIPHRAPGVPLPAINNILAMAFRSFYDPSLNTRQGAVNGGWVGEDDVDDGSAAPTMSALYSPENLAAAAAAVGATTTTTTVAASEGEERQGKMPMNGSAGMQSQPLALRPLALRPLAAKRDRDGKDEGEGPPSLNDVVGSDSPRRGGSTARGAAGKRVNAQATAPPAPENNTVAPSPGMRQRNPMPYPYADVDADEMGAVEALASALRNTQSGRNGAAGGMAGNCGVGRPSLTNIGPTVSGGNGAGTGGGRAGGGGGGGRLSANGETGSLVSIRTGAGVNTCPRGTAGNNGAATGTAQGGPVLDLQPPRPATAPPPQPPPQPQLPPPQQQQQQQAPPPHQRQPLPQQPQPQPQNQPQPPQPQPQAQAPPQNQPPQPQPLPQQQAPQQQQQVAARPYNPRPAGDHPPPQPQQVPPRQQPQQQMQHQRSAAPTLDVVSVLNMPGLRRQVLALPAETLFALLQSPNFGSDTEASVFVLVAMWLQANVSSLSAEQIQRVCSCIRLAALGGFYLSSVLPKLVLTGSKANALRPGGKWFDIPSEELHFLTRYATAGSTERALLADVARGTYDCTSHWYDMSSRMVGRPAEGFCFEWSIPTKDLRCALLNGSQPHATFTVKDDIADGDGSGATGDDDSGVIVSVPYVLCRGLEWHVFVDCQPRGGGAAAAGVFVYCRMPSCLRPSNGGSGVVGVVPGAGIRLGVHGWRCNRLEEVFVWTFGDETFFVPDAGMGCPSALPLRKRPASPSIGASGGNTSRPTGNVEDVAWTDYLHEGSLRGTLSFFP